MTIESESTPQEELTVRLLVGPDYESVREVQQESEEEDLPWAAGWFGLKPAGYPEDKPPKGAHVVHVVHPRRDLPTGSWREHGKDYVIHMLVGFLAALGMVVGPALEGPILAVPFVMLVLFVLVRQVVEFMRRRDTPGRDLQHYMSGFAVGILAGICVLLFLS